MRKSLIALVDSIRRDDSGTATAPRRARLQLKYTQLLNHAQLIMQYLRQAEQLAEADQADGGHAEEQQDPAGPGLRANLEST